ncbi:hypothetical protein LBMAG27_17770 [Bacteroidota bacterium]|nr:hypothetical protein LBMAG27_17770 [Bacteroidota bacterium]
MKIVSSVLLMCLFLLTTSTQNSNAQCSTGYSQIIVQITEDNYPQEISWDIKNAGGITLYTGTYNDDTICVLNGTCVQFTIHDAAGDGICCGYGIGSYSVFLNGSVVVTGGNYTYSEVTWLNCPPGTSCASALSAIAATSYVAPVNDTWYEFIPTANGMYDITTCNLNTCDTKIWVYDHCNNLTWNNTNIGTSYYDDNACGYQAHVSAALVAGTSYYIRIGEGGGGCGVPINWIINYGGPIVGCLDPLACNYNPNATVSDGSCIYPGDPNCPNGPDLAVMQTDFENSLAIGTINATNCQVTEGCLTGFGLRTVINFTTHIKNLGNQDYFIGNPGNNPGQFVFGTCHGHWHYQGYAEYDLYDTAGTMIPIGFKNGFCVLDLECSGGGTAQYGCSNMGISVGCGDIYSSGLDCQWLDITDVDTGFYTMAIKVNWGQSPDALGHYEMDYMNNWAQVCIHIFETAPGVKNFSVVQNCSPYYDCAGVLYGNTQPDCNGICGGPSKIGDLNADTLRTNTDGMLYVNYILGDSLIPAPCNDLNGDLDIDVYDAALLTGCANYGEAWPMSGGGIHNYCAFPTGLTNINDTATFKIIGADLTNHYIDIGIQNSDCRVLAYQFSMKGLTIQSVQSLVDPVMYPMTPSFSIANNLIVGLSYIDSSISKSTPFQPLCRIYYSATQDTVCIDSIYSVVNQLFQEVIDLKGDGCIAGMLNNAVPTLVQAHSSLSVYPNPTSGLIDVSIQLMNTQNATLEVTDALGRIVMINSLNNIFGKTISLSLKDYAEGVYFINLHTQNEVMTKRVVLINQ